MKRTLPLVFVLLAGMAIGYMIGRQTVAPDTRPAPRPSTRPEAPLPSPPPPPVREDHSAESARLQAEIDRLKAELARRPDSPGGAVSPPSPVRTAEATGDPDRGAIRVIIRDKEGNPLPGKTISILQKEAGKEAVRENAVTGPDGIAEFRGLDGGNTAVSVGLGSGMRSTTAPVVPGRFTEVRFDLIDGTVVTGVVSHREKGPLAKVVVSLSDSTSAVRTHFSATTDENGRYRIRDVPPGRYLITASGGEIGYARKPQAGLTVELPGPVTQDFVVGVPGLTGVVLDRETGHPIPGVRIQIQGGAFRSADSDAQGGFVFLDLPDGPHRLVVTKKGYGLIFLKGVMGTEPLTIELDKAATLRLAVTRPDGQPYIGRMYIGIAPVEGGRGTRVGTSLTTDEIGRGAYDKIVPGEYDLDLRADGVGTAKIRVTVPLGETSVDIGLK